MTKEFYDGLAGLNNTIEDLITQAEDELTGEQRSIAVAYLDDLSTDLRQFISEL